MSMKKLTTLIALMLCLSMVLAACNTGGTGSSAADSSAPAGESGEESSETGEEPGTDVDGEDEEEAEFDPSAFQVTAIDEQTLEVKLTARTPYFLELTAFPTYMPVPQHMVEANGEAWATAAATYVGNGPYKTTDWVPGSHITMEKNENYWEVDALGPDKIIFNLIEDPVPQLNAFQAGELQFIDDVPTAEIAALKSEPTFHVDAQLGTYYISLNNQVEPFDNPDVRKAFSLAIDREHIANVIGEGLWLPAGAWVAPGMNDADPTQDFRDVGGNYINPTDYEGNLAEAKQILADAGYPDGEGLPVIEYIYNDSSIHPQVAEALQDMWGELGATVNLEVQEWSTFLNTRKNGDFMAARDGWLNDYNDPIGMLDLFISSSGNNNSQLRDPDYDALIAQIKTTEDQAVRMQLMHEAEDLLMNNYVFAPVMYYADPYMMITELDSSVWASSLGYKYFMYAQGFEELNVCVGPNPDTIDPALNSSVDGATMIIHGFEGLYRLNKDGVPEPGLAESVDVSDDGLTYTFHLREGLAWSDGTPLTAEDFVYSWTRAIDPMTGADYEYMYDVIAGYEEAVGGASDH